MVTGLTIGLHLMEILNIFLTENSLLKIIKFIYLSSLNFTDFYDIYFVTIHTVLIFAVKIFRMAINGNG